MKTFGMENFKLDIYEIDTTGIVYSKIEQLPFA